ncbi:predicted protein [Arabidopsis lyrata subsp. lyrata]|uniref:Predicted protein n=1 Tax=Arabidopsis lyrata subsp. lyrata TaxID=81972 RepID=D7M6Y8_ARALL|nr:predicted protein [Arabidopsis lyrata subsp. lyrata]
MNGIMFCITWEVPSTKLSDEGGVDEQRARFGEVLDELISRFVSVYWKQVTAGVSFSRRCTNDMFYFNKTTRDWRRRVVAPSCFTDRVGFCFELAEVFIATEYFERED